MATATKLNVAIIDDHPCTRDGLRLAVEAWPHGRVVLEAGDGLEYEQACADAPRIDIAIVDLQMPRKDGFETIAWIKQHQPWVKVLAFTFNASDEVVYRALLADADGVLEKGSGAKELRAALDELRATGHVFNELMKRQLTHTPDPGSPMALRKKVEEELAPRELEFMLHYIGTDLPRIAEVATQMKISKNTAEGYRKAVVEKTGARKRTDLYKFALRFGLIKP